MDGGDGKWSDAPTPKIDCRDDERGDAVRMRRGGGGARARRRAEQAAAAAGGDGGGLARARLVPVEEALLLFDAALARRAALVPPLLALALQEGRDTIIDLRARDAGEGAALGLALLLERRVRELARQLRRERRVRREEPVELRKREDGEVAVLRRAHVDVARAALEESHLAEDLADAARCGDGLLADHRHQRALQHNAEERRRLALAEDGLALLVP